jgi:Rps23 Pro-64 3,4-dihydroxylase Tpa1-like proline 4-hydroxylase
MKQQTAVEWLIEQIFLNRKYITYEESIAFEKAKAMEKEQIIDARQDGVDVVFKGYSISNEEYYNETYGGDK